MGHKLIHHHLILELSPEFVELRLFRDISITVNGEDISRSPKGRSRTAVMILKDNFEESLRTDSFPLTIISVRHFI
jgi:hypothetical protein